MDEAQIGTQGAIDLPPQEDQNRQAFLRYLPRRIIDFERRIIRYRLAGWDPKGLVVLAGDAHRLADASVNYRLEDTRRALLALAQLVGSHGADLRGPDAKQVEQMFAMLAAVQRSLPPPAAAVDTSGTPTTTTLRQAVPAVAATAPPDDPVTPIALPASTESTEFAASIDSTPTIETESDLAAVDRSPSPSPDPATTMADCAAAAVRVMSAQPVRADTATAAENGTSACEADMAATAEPSSPTSDVAPTVDANQDCLPSPVAASPTPSSKADPAAADSDADAPAASTDCVNPPDAHPPADEVASHTVVDDSEEADVPADSGVHRIFHLGDGGAFADALARQLESEGYAIESVADVDELSEMLTCMLPNMLLVDASQVARLAIIGALRRDAQQHAQPPRHIQLAVLAAQDDIEIRRAAHRAGVDLLLLPPHDVASVSERLQALRAKTSVDPVRVLVVDDQRADALFAKGVLDRAGMIVRIVHDPMQVVPALAAERVDLILMDLHMPFANGVEVTMLLREDARFARIPIVFLSGESDPDSRLEAINAGGDEFLFKPIRPRHLVAAVQDRVRRLHAIEKTPDPAVSASSA